MGLGGEAGIISSAQSSADSSDQSQIHEKDHQNMGSGGDQQFSHAQKVQMQKKIRRLQQQVRELTQILKIEEENNQNVCKICLSKEIDTVFLNCAHRVMCRHCAHESVL